MKQIFDELSFRVSKHTTHMYSTSFSMGILALHPSIRSSVYALYGFVRLADEIVDSFHGYDKASLLARFKQQTTDALDERISIHPILQSFQQTVHQYQIDRGLIDQFFHSMEMDLTDISYDDARYQEYILGSAEVVGLMCLRIFVHGDNTQYELLKPSAMRLGAAFQKVNFLRDMRDDFHVLGRVYFPDVQPGLLNQDSKRQIEKDIEQDFAQALIGIRRLPASSRFGVYLAYKYYTSLFRKIRKMPAEKILKTRVRIPNGQKLSLTLHSYIRYKIALL